jgi:hypothetical protein
MKAVRKGASSKTLKRLDDNSDDNINNSKG